jgi:hypothetical protein
VVLVHVRRSLTEHEESEEEAGKDGGVDVLEANL